MDKKPTAQKDWTRGYIKYQVSEKYGSLTDLAYCYGLSPMVIRRALSVAYPKVDRVIAKALGVHPATIWPSRYSREVLANNPRLWRRWVNVEPSATNGDVNADCGTGV